MRSFLLFFLLSGIFFTTGCRDTSLPVRHWTPIPSYQEKSHPGTWIKIDSRSDSLSVMQGTKEIFQIKNIAFGVAGVRMKHRQGDGVTPVGSFRVHSVRPSERFVLFFELNYPTIEYAEQGRKEGVITQSEYESIISAAQRHILPPQHTALGGAIGIHGVGKGSLSIHRQVNWTSGCIAVENDQIQTLQRYVSVGTPVEVR